MEAILDPLEVGARVFGLFVESAASEHLFAPFGNVNGKQASRQPEVGRRGAAVVIGAVCEGGQGEPLPIRKLATSDEYGGTVDRNDHA